MLGVLRSAWALLLISIAAAMLRPAIVRDAPRASAGEPASRSLSELEADLRSAVASGSVEQAAACLQALGELDSPKAADAIIAHALKGTSYAIEMQAAATLLRSENPEVRSRVLEAASKHPNYKTRIVLFAVVARMADDPKSLQVLHAALKDPSKPVVLAALQWIRSLKKKESVEPLIAALEAKDGRPVDRVYFDLRKALEEITGRDLETGADWRGFWDAFQKGLSAPAKSNGERTVAYRSSFFSVAVDSDRVLFVIDVSGSMVKRDPLEAAGGEDEKARGKTGVGKSKREEEDAELPLSRQRLFRVKEELLRVVQGLQPHVQFGILAFNHEISNIWPSRVLRTATSDAKRAAVQWVRRMRPDGATRTDLALREALSIAEVDTVIVLTDGAPQDEKNNRLPIDPILAEVKAANRFLKARIHTISFVQIRDKNMRRFVRDLAVQNDGKEHLLP